MIIPSSLTSVLYNRDQFNTLISKINMTRQAIKHPKINRDMCSKLIDEVYESAKEYEKIVNNNRDENEKKD